MKLSVKINLLACLQQPVFLYLVFHKLGMCSPTLSGIKGEV